MKWSWRIGQVAGIGIYVHATFLVLLGWVALMHHLQRHSMTDALGGLLFIVALFGVVVLHELGTPLRRSSSVSAPVTLPCCPLAGWRGWSGGDGADEIRAGRHPHRQGDGD